MRIGVVSRTPRHPHEGDIPVVFDGVTGDASVVCRAGLLTCSELLCESSQRPPSYASHAVFSDLTGKGHNPRKIAHASAAPGACFARLVT